MILSEVVLHRWHKIWLAEDQDTLKRTYLVDYELYDKRSFDSSNAQAEIHIGVI